MSGFNQKTLSNFQIFVNYLNGLKCSRVLYKNYIVQVSNGPVFQKAENNILVWNIFFESDSNCFEI
jgi:hypothetical protein